jgi:hypothetical protein
MAPTFLGGAWLSALCTLRCPKTGLKGPKFSTGPPGLSGLPTAAHFPAQSECVRPAALAWPGSRRRADLPVVGGCSAGLVASEKSCCGNSIDSRLDDSRFVIQVFVETHMSAIFAQTSLCKIQTPGSTSSRRPPAPVDRSTLHAATTRPGLPSSEQARLALCKTFDEGLHCSMLGEISAADLVWTNVAGEPSQAKPVKELACADAVVVVGCPFFSVSGNFWTVRNSARFPTSVCGGR